MIILLNGPFGVGKTTVAQVLAQRIPGALIYDPELVGSLLRSVLHPIDEPEDFQDYSLWCPLVIDLGRRLVETYGRPLIIPMTLWHREYFDTITTGLRRIDQRLLCVRLTASRAVVVNRILGRPDEDGPHAWCLDHLDVSLAAAADPAFGIEVSTEGRTPADVADDVARLLSAEMRNGPIENGRPRPGAE